MTVPRQLYDKNIQLKNAYDTQSAAKIAMKTMQAVNAYEGLKEAMKALQMVDPFAGLRENLKALQMADPLFGLRETIKAMQEADPLAGIRESIKAFQGVDLFANVRESIKTLQLADPLAGYKESMQIFQQMANVSSSLNTEAYHELLKIYSAAEKQTEDRDQAITQTVTEIRHRIDGAPQGSLSLEFYLSLFISLVFFIYSLHASEESENRQKQLLLTVQQTLLEKINSINSDTIRGTYYLVVRPVKLNEKPNATKAGLLNVIYPNQRVRLVDEKGKWIRVEYFNFMVNKTETGWILKKYAKRMKTS